MAQSFTSEELKKHVFNSEELTELLSRGKLAYVVVEGTDNAWHAWSGIDNHDTYVSMMLFLLDKYKVINGKKMLEGMLIGCLDFFKCDILTKFSKDYNARNKNPNV